VTKIEHATRTPRRDARTFDRARLIFWGFCPFLQVTRHPIFARSRGTFWGASRHPIFAGHETCKNWVASRLPKPSLITSRVRPGHQVGIRPPRRTRRDGALPPAARCCWSAATHVAMHIAPRCCTGASPPLRRLRRVQRHLQLCSSAPRQQQMTRVAERHGWCSCVASRAVEKILVCG
jgi:hypothetical protein